MRLYTVYAIVEFHNDYNGPEPCFVRVLATDSRHAGRKATQKIRDKIAGWEREEGADESPYITIVATVRGRHNLDA